MNENICELQKNLNAILSIAKTSARLQIAGDMNANMFPEAKDPGIVAGQFEAIEMLCAKVAEMVEALADTPAEELTKDEQDILESLLKSPPVWIFKAGKSDCRCGEKS